MLTFLLAKSPVLVVINQHLLKSRLSSTEIFKICHKIYEYTYEEIADTVFILNCMILFLFYLSKYDNGKNNALNSAFTKKTKTNKHWIIIGDKQAIKPLKSIPSEWRSKHKGENQQMLSRQQKKCLQLKDDLFRAVEIWAYQK